MKKLLIGFLFLLAGAVLFGLPFENMRSTYYNHGIGLYSFEFSQGEIILQDWQKYEDQKEEDSIELPGYPGLYCKVFKDTYNLIRQDGFLIVKTKKRSFICLFKNSDICVFVEINSSPISTKRVYWG